MNNIIITIGRQYGSGGREIGEKLANKLGFFFYDTLLLEKVAKDSGLSDEAISKYDERLADKWLSLNLGMSNTADIHRFPIPLKVTIGQFEAIRKIGRTESAVIVGRCADYVLKEQNNVLSTFIYADINKRIERVSKRNNISLSEAQKRIKNTDRERAAFYNYYTDNNWGMHTNYNITIDSGIFGIEGTAEILACCIKEKS